jgi:hypothetical protein
MSTITSLNSTDSGATSRGVINTNFTNLNTDKLEASDIAGKVTGAASSTDNAIARFDGITGKVIQDSGITIDDNGNMLLASVTDTLNIIRYAGSSGSFGFRINGTSGAKTKTLADERGAIYGGGGWHEDGTPAIHSFAAISFWAAQDQTATAQGGYIKLETANLNTAARTEKVRVTSEGLFQITKDNGSTYAILDAGSIATTSKTFTFPNESGTLAVGTPWTTWTPTFNNFTKGSATIVARYTMIGKTVRFTLDVTLAADSSMGTTPTFTLPVNAIGSSIAGTHIIGQCVLNDSGTKTYVGVSRIVTATTANFEPVDTSAGYASRVDVQATVPMTWTTSDNFTVTGTYEAA